MLDDKAKVYVAEELHGTLRPMLEPLNERVAALEVQVDRLEVDTHDLRSFKEEMIRQLTELKSDIKSLNWKVAVYTGSVVVILNQFAQWGLRKLLP